MPKTFQIFVSLYRDAEKKTKDVFIRKNNQECANEYPQMDDQLEQTEFEKIKQSISEIGLLIMQSIRGNGSNSKELAIKLGVSVKTIKRRYKDLIVYGMIKTAPKCGIKVTLKGLQFLEKLGMKMDMGTIGTEMAVPNDPIDTIDPI
jgi:predicted transcriptional regulator